MKSIPLLVIGLPSKAPVSLSKGLLGWFAWSSTLQELERVSGVRSRKQIRQKHLVSGKAVGSLSLESSSRGLRSQYRRGLLRLLLRYRVCT